MTEYVLSLSYGKDSLACLGAIVQLGWRLDRIIHAEVWAADTVHADLPSMVEFKAKADKIIKEMTGVEVEHLCAVRNGEKLTYEKLFYHIPMRKEKNAERFGAKYNGFPLRSCPWCNSRLKIGALRLSLHSKELVQGTKINTVQYLGIAACESERIERHTKPGIMLPLVEAGWDEAYCRQWCEEHDLLSPIYTTATRGGCWFCHNQGIDSLRSLRRNYPDLWALLMKWDLDSPVTFKADGHTVHDFDRRFEMEDAGKVPVGRSFRWAMLDKPPMFVPLSFEQMSFF